MGRFMGCRGVERSGGHSRFKALVRDDVHVPTNQNQDQITAICANLIGQRIALLQVLGINALKSLRPSPDDLVGDVIEATDLSERVLTIHTKVHTVTIDLQRTGKLASLPNAEPYQTGEGLNADRSPDH